MALIKLPGKEVDVIMSLYLNCSQCKALQILAICIQGRSHEICGGTFAVAGDAGEGSSI